METSSILALWFHWNGRGEGRHAGKIHYRMEYFAKKSTKRVFHRHRNQPESADEVALPGELDVAEVIEDLESLIAELKFIVPTDQAKTHILDLWKKTIKIRNEHRIEETFLTFMNDFPVASAFSGMLLAYDYTTIYPKAFEFKDSWKDIQPKILDRYRDMFRFIKSDVVRALAVVRQKNPTRGSKRSREEDQNLRKMNPLHGVIQWINHEKAMPTPSIPQMIIRGEEFEDGECFIVWNNVTVKTESNVLEAFIILCKVFAVFNVACSPSDKLFYSFFGAVCHKVEKMSTTATKFLDLL
nr:uncharacterized protein LOC115265251 isoform X1 [Aedes albopictus]